MTLRLTFSTIGLPVFGLNKESITTSIPDYTGEPTDIDQVVSL
jgi:hypothetical protein